MKLKNFFSALFFCIFSICFSQEYGLVLAGGGGKGAYQAGVWKALNEYGIAQKVTVISGTSVGGLNAAMFASASARDAEQIWMNEVSAKLTKDSRLISQEGLSELLDSFPLEDLHDSPVQVYVTAVRDRLKALKFIKSKLLGAGVGSYAHYFKLNRDSKKDMKSKLLATSAFPLICDSVFVNDGDGGHNYSDGGEESVGGDNIPIKPIITNHPNIKNIIVVYLSDKNHVSRRISAKDYDNINLIEIFPSIDIDGDGFFESIIDGTTNFTQSRIKLLLQKGYDDTVEYLQRKKIYPVSEYWFN